MTWLAEDRPWRSGAWQLARRDDELADISFEGRVVLRSIRAVVRDRDWNTATLTVTRVRAGADSLTLSVRSAGLGSSFRGVVRVEARGDRLRVTCDLESAADFDTNRTGLVVLHPPQLAGTPLHVTHPHGDEDTAFPVAISPHQPVRDIAGLAWKHDGIAVGLRFDGDTFEMEDQRNWTDASYKTYSRPLALPFPYRVAGGARVVQTVQVTAQTVGDAAARPVADAIVLHEGSAAFPAIGVAAAAHAAATAGPVDAPAAATPIDARPVPIGAPLLVELDLGDDAWREKLRWAAASRTALDVRFVLPTDGDTTALGPAVAELHGLDVARVAVFASSGPAAHVSEVGAVAALRRAMRDAGVQAPVVGGARSHFTELNREHHRLPADLDGVVFSLTPLFHAQGTEQLIESVPMQRLVARQATEIAAGRPVHIGPVTLRPRFNNVATAPGAARVAPPVDDRQASSELGAWTVASIAALAVPGVASLTFFDETSLRDENGEPLPAASALAAVAALDGRLLQGASPDGLVWATGARRGDEAIVFAANLDRRERAITVQAGAEAVESRLAAFSWCRHAVSFGKVEA